MSPEIQKLFDDAGVDPGLHMNGTIRSEAIQLSIATSLKRIADNLDLVMNHNTFQSTSISVSVSGERG